MLIKHCVRDAYSTQFASAYVEKIWLLDKRGWQRRTFNQTKRTPQWSWEPPAQLVQAINNAPVSNSDSVEPHEDLDCDNEEAEDENGDICSDEVQGWMLEDNEVNTSHDETLVGLTLGAVHDNGDFGDGTSDFVKYGDLDGKEMFIRPAWKMICFKNQNKVPK